VNALFLDTAGWFAAIAPNQTGHAVARRIYTDAARSGRSLVTTSLVVAEMHALLLRWRSIDAARRFLAVALDPAAHRVVHPDEALIEETVHSWISRYSDQPFSLCDAVSFEVMRRERIREALTYDRHFAAAGYEML
jgi:predicted nucleic acid-binding protein